MVPHLVFIEASTICIQANLCLTAITTRTALSLTVWITGAVLRLGPNMNDATIFSSFRAFQDSQQHLQHANCCGSFIYTVSLLSQNNVTFWSLLHRSQASRRAMKLEIDLVVHMECAPRTHYLRLTVLLNRYKGNVARHISPRLYLFARQASLLPSSAHIL
ncbi:hypothetical protein P692DRAFT_20566729 [Suillus brevipes Sb2]|nr:hypothetical protein P692DRAFT_20566729 [Suillus brevipes Sb2]